ncbi:hypothetical protein [Weissella bombi]|uniref:hypothetical protein n=1 Tax=Weissella bombi TaxID=1505725 RepID=UPI003AF2D13E
MKLTEAEQIMQLVDDNLPDDELVYVSNPFLKDDVHHENGFELVFGKFNTTISDFKLAQHYYAVLVDQNKNV